MKKAIKYIIIIAIAWGVFCVNAYALRPSPAKDTVIFAVKTPQEEAALNTIFAAVKKAKQDRANEPVKVLFVCTVGAERSGLMVELLEKFLKEVGLEDEFDVSRGKFSKLEKSAKDYDIIISAIDPPDWCPTIDSYAEKFVLFVNIEWGVFPVWNGKIDSVSVLVKNNIEKVIKERLIPVLGLAIKTQGNCAAKLNIPQPPTVVDDSA